MVAGALDVMSGLVRESIFALTMEPARQRAVCKYGRTTAATGQLGNWILGDAAGSA